MIDRNRLMKGHAYSTDKNWHKPNPALYNWHKTGFKKNMHCVPKAYYIIAFNMHLLLMYI